LRPHALPASRRSTLLVSEAPPRQTHSHQLIRFEFFSYGSVVCCAPTCSDARFNLFFLPVLATRQSTYKCPMQFPTASPTMPKSRPQSAFRARLAHFQDAPVLLQFPKARMRSRSQSPAHKSNETNPSASKHSPPAP